MTGNLGVFGFGNMGQALIKGLLANNIFSNRQLYVYDPDSSKIATARELDLRTATSYGEIVANCDYLLLACKPQQMRNVLEEIRSVWTGRPVVLSIAAGISTKFIQSILGTAVKVIRVMPNTPALVSCGASGIALGEGCGQAEEQLAREIFDSVGITEVVSEDLMDAVTALSGSGPAYFFYMVECLVKAAMTHGLSEEQSARLAIQTLLGAGRLLAESHESPETLRARVTSKGGTTEAALKCLTDAGFSSLIARAIEAAVVRSRELGQ